jgi:magnesium chelatase family protein
MRQPIIREVTISRAKFTVTHPSSFMASMNLSPSGFNDPDAPQTSSPHEMQTVFE